MVARGKEEESGIFQTPFDQMRKLSHTHNSKQHGGCPWFAVWTWVLRLPQVALFYLGVLFFSPKVAHR